MILTNHNAGHHWLEEAPERPGGPKGHGNKRWRKQENLIAGANGRMSMQVQNPKARGMRGTWGTPEDSTAHEEPGISPWKPDMC